MLDEEANSARTARIRSPPDVPGEGRRANPDPSATAVR